MALQPAPCAPDSYHTCPTASDSCRLPWPTCHDDPHSKKHSAAAVALNNSTHPQACPNTASQPSFALALAAFCEELLRTAGSRFAGPIAILRNWTFCLFYVMAELWGSVVVSVLFWGFANQVTTVNEASQFYPIFGLGANVALVFSGQTVIHFSKVWRKMGPNTGKRVPHWQSRQLQSIRCAALSCAAAAQQAKGVTLCVFSHVSG